MNAGFPSLDPLPPLHFDEIEGVLVGEPRLTPRDEFALRAMAIVAPGWLRAGATFISSTDYAGLAADAYALADSMLAAREVS